MIAFIKLLEQVFSSKTSSFSSLSFSSQRWRNATTKSTFVLLVRRCI